MFKHSKLQPESQYVNKPVAPDTLGLIKQVQKFVSQNKRIYNEIHRFDPTFSYKLYEPVSHHGIDQMFIKPLILRQIDQLIQQNQRLSTKKEVLNLLMSEQKKKKQREITNSTNHYSFLRSTWSKLQMNGLNSSQKVDGLNKVIGILKNNIKFMTQNQNQFICKELREESQNHPYLTKKVLEQNREQIQRLNMRNEELQTRYAEVLLTMEHKNKKIDQLQESIVQLKKQISLLTKNESEVRVSNPCLDISSTGKEKLQNLSEEANYLQFSASSQGFQIKITTSCLSETLFEQTYRKLDQILAFLRSGPIYAPVQSNADIFSDLPCLNLNLNSNKTKSTQNTIFSATDRYFPSQMSKISKFIPMKTQRSHRLKTSDQVFQLGIKKKLFDGNEINNIEEDLQNQKDNNYQKFKQNLENKVNNNIDSEMRINNTMLTEIGVKRFIRKADFPLTSDRFKKGRMGQLRNII